MDTLIQDKTDDFLSFDNLRMTLLPDASDRLECSHEINSFENTQYGSYEILHEVHLRDKLVINSRDHFIDYFAAAGRLRGFR